MLKKIAIALIVVAGIALAVVWAAGMGLFGRHEGAGKGTGRRRPVAEVERAEDRQQRAALTVGAPATKQILFGDLHVHTTLSTDAFMLSLPIAQGEGAHPPADACDFARFCSALDFWSINDHAEGLTSRQWGETVEAIRQCDALGQKDGEPDTVPFLGWEWTQVGITPQDHYGHKNVVLRGLGAADVPARPIASRGMAASAMSAPGPMLRGLLAFSAGGRRMHDFARFLAERARSETCPDGVSVRELPAHCLESVATPAELFRKLDEWGVEAIVIPHGTTWGFYTPPGSSWDKQLSPEQHDPDRQTLVEIYSGHGNSEEYREWRSLGVDAAGRLYCPEPSADYLPTCWRAGELIRERCLAAGEGEGECERRAEEARAFAVEAGVAAHLVVSGESPDDWLDAGQCRDCFQPAFNYRPLSSVQYMMALRRFDEGEGPRRFRFGFLSSSDNHFARPGTGYKEAHRRGMTESRDSTGIAGLPLVGTAPGEPLPRAVHFDRGGTALRGFQLVELERQASFFLSGGLAAVHAKGRSRAAIWQAFQRREVYGTSGPRILLWFDLLNPGGSATPAPMGSSISQREVPQFEVRAVGSFEQGPGCPDYAATALGPERLALLCKDDCYHPTDVRRPIDRIEVVRIRPQGRRGEPVGPLIEDPWRVFPCEADPAGCVVRFDDPEFTTAGRDTLYYVRAVEPESLAINAANLRCEYDADGRCRRVERCGTERTVGDDCLAPTEQRAWSSPIFVDWNAGS